MMQRHITRRKGMWTGFLPVLLAGWLALGVAARAEEAGRIVLAVGEARMAGAVVREGDIVPAGVELSTGADGYLYLKTVDNGFLILRPGSVATVEAYHVDPADPKKSRFKFSLRQGVARSISGEAVGKARKNFRFNTPVAAIGVRGTDFSIYANALETRVAVVSGGVVVSGFGGGCLPQGNGPCEGADSRELFAGTLGVLQFLKGQDAPRIIEDRTLSPDLMVPPRNDEPAVSATSKTGKVRTGETNLDPLKQSQLQPVVWGRWQQISEDLPATVDIADAEESGYATLTIPNNSYILIWNRENAVQTPVNGSLGFSLEGSMAHVDGPGGQAEALVRGGRLDFNFAQSSFSTRINLEARGVNHALHANGSVAADGMFRDARNLPGNMTVRGALFGTAGAITNASYVFQSTLENGMEASGITYWGTPTAP